MTEHGWNRSEAVPKTLDNPAEPCRFGGWCSLLLRGHGLPVLQLLVEAERPLLLLPDVELKT